MMKNLLLLIFSIVLLFSCEKNEITYSETNEKSDDNLKNKDSLVLKTRKINNIPKDIFNRISSFSKKKEVKNKSNLFGTVREDKTVII